MPLSRVHLSYEAALALRRQDLASLVSVRQRELAAECSFLCSRAKSPTSDLYALFSPETLSVLQKPVTSFLSLPFDIHNQFSTYMDHSTLSYLTQTNRYLHGLYSPWLRKTLLNGIDLARGAVDIATLHGPLETLEFLFTRYPEPIRTQLLTTCWEVAVQENSGIISGALPLLLDHISPQVGLPLALAARKPAANVIIALLERLPEGCEIPDIPGHRLSDLFKSNRDLLFQILHYITPDSIAECLCALNRQMVLQVLHRVAANLRPGHRAVLLRVAAETLRLDLIDIYISFFEFNDWELCEAMRARLQSQLKPWAPGLRENDVAIIERLAEAGAGLPENVDGYVPTKRLASRRRAAVRRVQIQIEERTGERKKKAPKRRKTGDAMEGATKAAEKGKGKATTQVTTQVTEEADMWVPDQEALSQVFTQDEVGFQYSPFGWVFDPVHGGESSSSAEGFLQMYTYPPIATGYECMCTEMEETMPQIELSGGDLVEHQLIEMCDHLASIVETEDDVVVVEERKCEQPNVEVVIID